MIPITVHGAGGRLGSRIVALARAGSDFQVVAELGRGDLPARLPAAPGLVIDASTPVALAADLDPLAARAQSLLVLTTGLEATLLARLEALAERIPVLVAPNTSLGVAVLRTLARRAALLLPDWDLALCDTHHRHKLDAPSGTAKAILADLQSLLPAGQEVQVQALRLGGVVGDHELILAGPDEVLTLGHRALSRDVFARGALAAARFLHGRPPGRYGMEDVVGLGGGPR